MDIKKSLLYSYVRGVCRSSKGQDYSKITAYFLPEFITAAVLYAMPIIVDARFIACLESTPLYATLGATNNFLHFITKIAEGLSIGTVIMTGHFNGSRKFKRAGGVLINSFWTTVILGATTSLAIYFGAEFIYRWYGIPEELISLGIPFLRIRAVSVFFVFLYFAFIAFLRGVKNTRVPMYIFIGGSIVFLCFDYLLIFGKCGFPALQLQGSAWATLIQYVFMVTVALFYILLNRDMHKYYVSLFSHFAHWHNVKRLFELSWPVVVDKGTLAGAYLWLGKCIAPMGTCVIASFTAIKDLERFGLLPAIAFAQVVTLLVSNDSAVHDWDGIKVTVKRVLLLSCAMTMAILFFCSLSPSTVIRMFDMKGEFTDFAAKLFPIISVLAIFDILQLILASAMRGAANVKVVMWTRLIICGCVFMPLSYFFSQLSITNQIIKFMLVYSSLYFSNALMAAVYIRRFRGHKWIEQAIRKTS